MEQTGKSKITNKIVVLISVIALVLTGWLAGHIVRFSISSFWHPPVEEITPQIQNGFQSDGIRREVVLLGMGFSPGNRAAIPGGLAFASCVGNTYYTSLPAKCRSADGRLVKVGVNNSYILLMPDEK